VAVLEAVVVVELPEALSAPPQAINKLATVNSSKAPE